MFATCATLAAVLAAAPGGSTIALRGDCARVTIARSFPSMVTVDASKARVSGLALRGANLRWVGGTLSAPGGPDAKGPPGYALLIAGRNIRLEGATVTGARKGIVIDKASNVAIDRVKFWRLREDGIIASQTKGLTVTNSQFTESLPRPSVCTGPDGRRTEGVGKRNCRGEWIDGNHADAVQMRHGVTDARIAFNTISGPTQGITQMDTTGDAPLQRVVIENNRIETSAFHQITLTECTDCVIRSNRVRAEKGWARRAVIRPGRATRCGNDVADDLPDRACR